MTAMTTTTQNVTITDVVRVGTSRNGNPTYDIVTDSGTYRTQVDGQVGYAATNYRPRSDSNGTRAILTLTKAGRVIGIDARSDA